MSIKSKVFAGAAALSVMAGGLGVAGAATAHASTSECGKACVEISNGGAVLDVYKKVAAVNQKVIMWGASNYDPATDFTISREGSVHQFYKAGLATAALNLHYGWAQAYQIQYTPYGAPTGLCVASYNAAGGPVTLRPCGLSAKSTWVAVQAFNTNGGFILINGADTNFSDPTVLTNRSGNVYNSQLRAAAQHNQGFSSVQDNQVWDISRGPAA
jgi:hypothetical protein